MWNICSGNKCDLSVCEVESSGFNKWKWIVCHDWKPTKTSLIVSTGSITKTGLFRVYSVLWTCFSHLLITAESWHVGLKLSCVYPGLVPFLFMSPDTAMTITPAAKTSAWARASLCVWSVWGSERVPVCDRLTAAGADCADQLLSLLISVSFERKNRTAGVQHPYFCAEYSICTALYLMAGCRLWGGLQDSSLKVR